MKPTVRVNLKTIEENARSIVTQCKQRGIAVTGVTKVTLGLPEVALAMRRGGVESLGDSRLENIQRMLAAGVPGPFLLLRLPHLSEVESVVDLADLSLNSELAIVKALAAAAQKKGKRHGIIAMVELGDLREGMLPRDLRSFVREILCLDSVTLEGIGTNLTDLNGVLPSSKNFREFIQLVEEIEGEFGLRIPLISAGNSSSLPFMKSNQMPARVNHLRLGESILLGLETAYRQPWEGTRQNVFCLSAEIIELKWKPSVPRGEIGEDAFGRKPVFADKGEMLRGILNVGRQDCRPEGLTPYTKDLRVIGATSDYLIVDATQAPHLQVGSRVEFGLSYGSLLAAMTSPFVEKVLE